MNTTSIWLRVALPLAALAVEARAGGPYKCEGNGGVPVYQQQPCADGRELRNLAQSVPSVSVLPFAQATPAAPRKGRAEKPPRPPPKEKQKASGDASERRHVKEGMSDGEVLAKLGAPDLQSGRGRTMRWTYLPTPADLQTVTVVRFEDGRVKEVDRRILR